MNHFNLFWPVQYPYNCFKIKCVNTLSYLFGMLWQLIRRVWSRHGCILVRPNQLDNNACWPLKHIKQGVIGYLPYSSVAKWPWYRSHSRSMYHFPGYQDILIHQKFLLMCSWSKPITWYSQVSKLCVLRKIFEG